MANNFFIVGAFDRHNYGDLLFPLIHTQYIRSKIPNANIVYASITSSDLSPYGGYPTISVKTLLAKPLTPDDVIVLCGGDILSADWLLMLGHVSPAPVMKLFKAARRIFGLVTTNNLAKILLGEKNTFPYVISRKDTQAQIFYTAVGGAGFKIGERNDHLQRVCNELRNVKRISVRDREILSLLGENGICADLVPDTALVMSRFFPKSFLENRNWCQQIEFFGDFNLPRYFSFQGAKRLLSGKEKELALQLKEIYQSSGVSPMFVPIGRAPDHEDHIPLRKIFEELKQLGVPCAFQDSGHVLDIMASLAFANTYIGTSLHGAITTYAFGHKVAALFPSKLKKLHDFLHTWMQVDDFILLDDMHFSEPFTQMISNETAIGDWSGLLHHQEKVLDEFARYCQPVHV